MKKERQIKSTIDTNKQTLTIEVALEGKEPFKLGLDDLHADMVVHAALHGLKQKVVDAAALGAGYTLTEKYLAMQEVIERLFSAEPTWNKRAEGGGSVTGLLYRALVRLYPDKEVETIREYHDKLDKSQQYALRKNPKVAAIIEEIKAESVDTSAVDTDSMLDELGGLE